MLPPPTEASDIPAAGSRVVWTLATGAAVVVASLSLAVTFERRSVPLVTSNFTNVYATVGEIAAAVGVAAWLVATSLRRRPVAIGPPPLAVAAAVLLAAAWLSVPGAIDPSLAAWSALRLTLAVAFGIVVSNVVRPADLTPAVVAVVAIHAAVGIGQAVAQRSMGLGWLGEPQFAPGVPGASIVTSADGIVLLRAYGLAGSPNILGGLLAAAIVLLAAGHARSVWGRAVLAAATVAAGMALVLTFSRGAWIAVIVGLAVVGAMVARAGDRVTVRRWVGSVAALVIAIAVLVPSVAPFLAARATAPSSIATEARSIEERLALNGQTLAVLRERPVLGTGIGQLPLAIAAAFPESTYGRAPAHVVPLTVAAETGVAGGLAWLALLATPWLLLATRRRRWTRDLAIASGALAAFSVVGFFDYYPWGSPMGRLWWALLLGLWMAAWRAAGPAMRPAAHASSP